MITIVPIVEGHGEVPAVPVLLRQLGSWIAPAKTIQVNAPIRTNKSRFLNNAEEFRKMVQLAKYKAADTGWVLILLDADDDCPVELCAAVKNKAEEIVAVDNVAIVIANREFEAWFIAAANSLAGVRGLTLKPEMQGVDPEAPRDAKGWMGRQMPSNYHEVSDQPAFAARMSMEEAWMSSRSFRHLASEFVRISNNFEL